MSDLFSIEELISLNKFSSNSKIDGVELNEDFNYFSADTNIRYYVGNYFLNSEKLDLFLNGGFGFYNLDGFNTTANLGGGVSYWFRDNLAVRIQSLAKFTLGNKDELSASNHLQYFLQLVYSF
ncbi:MAG: hypothetical protein IIC74_10985 [Bacteroidetes bacterium]|nr:hypothetical protein [Bacteroidota bacterium]